EGAREALVGLLDAAAVDADADAAFDGHGVLQLDLEDLVLEDLRGKGVLGDLSGSEGEVVEGGGVAGGGDDVEGVVGGWERGDDVEGDGPVVGGAAAHPVEGVGGGPGVDGVCVAGGPLDRAADGEGDSA